MPNRALGDFELCVLTGVARLGADAYGLRIREAVALLRGRECAVGAVYTALQRLETKGYVASRMTDPLPVRGGRARRAYRVTATGARALQASRRVAARVWTLDLGGTTS